MNQGHQVKYDVIKQNESELASIDFLYYEISFVLYCFEQHQNHENGDISGTESPILMGVSSKYSSKHGAYNVFKFRLIHWSHNKQNALWTPSNSVSLPSGSDVAHLFEKHSAESRARQVK